MYLFLLEEMMFLFVFPFPFSFDQTESETVGEQIDFFHFFYITWYALLTMLLF